MNTEITNSQLEILNSWKEVAHYLGRGVRTVQRWEVTLGLPVRRPHGRGRSAVIAMRSDLDHWLKACPTRNGNGNGNGKGSEHKQQGLSPTEKLTVELLLQSRQLREDVRGARTQLRSSIEQLVQTLGRMNVAGRPARFCADGETRGDFQSGGSVRV